MPGYYPSRDKKPNKKRRKNATVSKSSPKSSSRGCLCPDGKTYHKDCCDGTLEAQGVGKV
jgi:hypothetical protein|tara:strand:+ start:8555 stop:8734 length:180 start_codon:yes stop_codon:yes gene_type:complete